MLYQGLLVSLVSVFDASSTWPGVGLSAPLTDVVQPLFPQSFTSLLALPHTNSCYVGFVSHWCLCC